MYLAAAAAAVIYQKRTEVRLCAYKHTHICCRLVVEQKLIFFRRVDDEMIREESEEDMPKERKKEAFSFLLTSL